MLPDTSTVLSIWDEPNSSPPRGGIVCRPGLQTQNLEKNGGKRNKEVRGQGLELFGGRRRGSEMLQELRKMDGEGTRNVLKWLRCMSVLLVFEKNLCQGQA